MAEQQLPVSPTLDDVHGIPADRWYETPPAVTSGTCRAPHLAACLICGIHCRYQSPAASAGGAESSPPEVSAHPSAPSGERGPSLAETSPELLALLERAAAEWGGLGVARAAAQLIGYVAVPAIETGHDMGVSAASEFFPQSQKHRSK